MSSRFDRRELKLLPLGERENLLRITEIAITPEQPVPALAEAVDTQIKRVAERIRTAQLNYPQIHFRLANAESLPFPDCSFGLVTAFTVFTSILSQQTAVNISAEIERVLTPGGGLLWYDFRMSNPFNRQVRGVSRKDIHRLFPGFGVALESISLLPLLARRLGALTDCLYAPLRSVPFLRTHFLGLLTKP